jgi:hypothetical protein
MAPSWPSASPSSDGDKAAPGQLNLGRALGPPFFWGADPHRGRPNSWFQSKHVSALQGPRLFCSATTPGLTRRHWGISRCCSVNPAWKIPSLGRTSPRHRCARRTFLRCTDTAGYMRAPGGSCKATVSFNHHSIVSRGLRARPFQCARHARSFCGDQRRPGCALTCMTWSEGGSVCRRVRLLPADLGQAIDRLAAGGARRAGRAGSGTVANCLISRVYP